MSAIGMGISPASSHLLRPKMPLRVPAGRAALVDCDGRYLTGSDGAVLLGDAR